MELHHCGVTESKMLDATHAMSVEAKKLLFSVLPDQMQTKQLHPFLDLATVAREEGPMSNFTTMHGEHTYGAALRNNSGRARPTESIALGLVLPLLVGGASETQHGAKPIPLIKGSPDQGWSFPSHPPPLSSSLSSTDRLMIVDAAECVNATIAFDPVPARTFKRATWDRIDFCPSRPADSGIPPS